MEDDLVMQCPAEQRMRMADDGRMRRIFRAGIEQRFEAPCRAFEEERSDRGIVGDHSF